MLVKGLLSKTWLKHVKVIKNCATKLLSNFNADGSVKIDDEVHSLFRTNEQRKVSSSSGSASTSGAGENVLERAETVLKHLNKTRHSRSRKSLSIPKTRAKIYRNLSF